MSLFARTALSLLIGALLIAGIGAVGLRYFVHRQIRQEVDAQLRHNWRRMAAHLTQTRHPLPPLVSVLDNWRAVPVAPILTQPPTYSDTTESDLVNGKRVTVPVRLLKQTATVGGQRFLFTLKQPYEEFEEIAENVTVAVVIFFLGSVLLLVLIELALHRRIWRPFYGILDQLRTYQLDQTGASPFPLSYIREFNRLSDTLNQMVSSSRQQYHLQKQFTQNAAHELQTPLAIATAELEQLEQSERLSQGDWSHLDRASQALGRLNNLSRSLLLLTKIETQQYAEAEPIDLSQLLHHLVGTYDDFARHKQMVIEPAISPDITVRINRQLAEVMLANLLKNAIRHGQAQNPIQVGLTAERLSLVNVGDPLPFPAEQLFDRFVKDTAKSESTGLGLALVKQIADRYQLPVTYSYDTAGRLHRFEVHFSVIITQFIPGQRIVVM